MADERGGGPSFLARLILVLLGVAFLGAAWVWHRKDTDPNAARLVERVSGGRVHGGAANP
ncbi:hypothetical protein D7X55_25235 [Corallococcus sp. AB049A]|uniref:Uncharacterized protein n=1 Tax=Corallococcus interemptor TaxID=2316720 RepID=A0A3A8QQC3_9BACT|nr:MULTISPECIES: hypothetical protein [Corallococcus]RKH45705.1 hypothetical protein D7Y23_25210 [Corallococcus sp. AB050B]RKH65374.1 hypothetical protein D7X96_23720 [Corallococcus interemptor]RKI59824.1 hypothetical protein D7X55_25235 [Corallococcus sp. AB049A]